jgi:hypothetical protein
MIQEGQIVLFAFPQTDLVEGKLRPALVLRSLPGPHADWLICMISTRLHEEVPELDEVLRESDPDFLLTGLKSTHKPYPCHPLGSCLRGPAKGYYWESWSGSSRTYLLTPGPVDLRSRQDADNCLSS